MQEERLRLRALRVGALPILNQFIARMGLGRVEMWRGDGRLNISVCRLFRLAVP
jgi:hypothetical protein